MSFPDFDYPPLDITRTAQAISQAFDDEVRKLEFRLRRETGEPVEIHVSPGRGHGYERIVEILTQFDAYRTEALKLYRANELLRVQMEPRPVMFMPIAGISREALEKMTVLTPENPWGSVKP